MRGTDTREDEDPRPKIPQDPKAGQKQAYGKIPPSLLRGIFNVSNFFSFYLYSLTLPSKTARIALRTHLQGADPYVPR